MDTSGTPPHETRTDGPADVGDAATNPQIRLPRFPAWVATQPPMVGTESHRTTAPPSLSDVSAVVEAVGADLARLIPVRPAGEQETDDAQQVLELAS